jgi:hypothetical protein
MHRPLALALALALALPAAGADSDADARARAVAPFLDEQTLAVARLDLTKVDAVTLATTLTDLGVIDADETQDIKARAARWLGDFARAGGKDLYVVVSLADFPSFPFVVVPLGEGADARAIAGLLDLPDLPPGLREKVGEVVFAGSPAARERLRSLKPQARPELAQALAAAGDGAAQVALIPPPHLARVIEEMMPVLPKEVGGVPSKVLTRGVKWAALSLDVRPRTALRLTIKSPDAAAAKALLQEALPGFLSVVTLPPPTVAEDRVTFSLAGREVRSWVGPLVRRAIQAAARAESGDRLSQLVRAMHGYADSHQRRFPAVASFDKAGKPLLSWRVHLLPALGEEKLYEEFHLDEPWNSEHNKKLIARMPAVFRGPSRRLNEQGKTVYLAPVGERVAFTGTATGRRLPQDFPDGTSNTILFVEADAAHAVEWTKPEDLKIDPDKPATGLARQGGRFLVVLADGFARPVKDTVRKETLWAAFTPSGGEVLGDDWE